jgi:hypothetical protein
MVALLNKRYSATTYGTIYLLLLLAVAAVVEAYEQPAIGQITPAANPANDTIDQNTDEEVMPVIEDTMSADDSIKSSEPTTSNSSESQDLGHKYTTTPDSIGSLNEETLLEKIFNKVGQDLKASGITGTYP